MTRPAAGFTLLPVILAMGLIAAIAFLLNRDTGVNAEMVSRQSDLDRARYAAEAGLQAANAVMQGKNCSGPYSSAGQPVTNGNLGGASYSAYASPSSGNVVSLVSTGTFKGTSVTLRRDNVIAYQLTPKTYTLQPNAATGIDTFIKFNSVEINGTDAQLKLKSGEHDVLIRFDLSSFPAGSLPLSAVLSLYPNSLGGGGPHGVALYRLSNSWQQLTASWFIRQLVSTWTTPGGDYAPAVVASLATTVKDVWSDFDVTDLAGAWLLGRLPNYGVILRRSGVTSDITYWSSNFGTSALRPKLNFTYLLPCGATGPSNLPPTTTTTVTLTSVADAHIDEKPADTTGTGTQMTPLRDALGKEGQAIVRFDTSVIPPGSVVSAAKLRLYLAGSFGNGTFGYGAYRITESWTEATAVWGLAYDAGTQLALINITLAQTGQWYEWTIPPALVQEWVDGISPNNGLLVRYETLQNNRKAAFNTRESANVPQLVVTY